MDRIIEISDLSKSFKGVKALDKINLNIKKGRVTGLLGPNGSGKSTLMKLIAGLLKKDVGEILVAGNKLGVKSRSLISYLPDSYNLFDKLRVDESIDMYEDFYPDFNRKICMSMIEYLSIPLEPKCGSLSKGLKERLLLSLTLARDSEVYILDEPVDGVDPAARDAILDLLISRIETGRSFIISTHQVKDMGNLFDEVIFLNEGRLVKEGSSVDIRRESGLDLDGYYKRINNLL